MGRQSIWEYFRSVYARYRQAAREVKRKILDEFCANTKYNRKYAFRLLNGPRSIQNISGVEGPPIYRAILRFYNEQLLAFQAGHLRPIHRDGLDDVWWADGEYTTAETFNLAGYAIAILHHNDVRALSRQNRRGKKKRGTQNIDDGSESHVSPPTCHQNEIGNPIAAAPKRSQWSPSTGIQMGPRQFDRSIALTFLRNTTCPCSGLVQGRIFYRRPTSHLHLLHWLSVARYLLQYAVP